MKIRVSSLILLLFATLANAQDVSFDKCTQACELCLHRLEHLLVAVFLPHARAVLQFFAQPRQWLSPKLPATSVDGMRMGQDGVCVRLGDRVMQIRQVSTCVAQE